MKVRYGGTLGNMDSLILATFCLGAMVGVVSVSWECQPGVSHYRSSVTRNAADMRV